MKINELFDRYYEINESKKNTPCIVVDIQPEYAGIHDGEDFEFVEKLMDFLNRQTGPVLMYVNAEKHGLTPDTIPAIKEYWEDSGFDPDNWNRVSVVDKGFGYLRSWIDYPVSDAAIIKTIRYLYKNRLHDSGHIPFEDLVELLEADPNLDDEDMEELEEDPISINWTSVAQLKNFNGAYLMGGGYWECLAEIRLIMNAFNIKYRIIDEFVYGK